ncbi:anthranilate synthase component I [Qipengyuania sp. DSG2-2]|uniref:anthranilate synthase component I n=1 Tax=Qipengyuania sp. DGS2-2 TaxID=3349631 RepID=UPI0036D28D1D
MTPAGLSNAENARALLESGKAALVWRELVADTETPVGAALKLMEPGRGDFLLESVEGGEVRGRYSLLGIDPDLVFRSDTDGAAINRQWQRDRLAFEPDTSKPTDALRALIDSSRIDVPEGLPPALACVVGYFSYETIGMVEDVPRAGAPGLGLPDMVFTRPTLLLVFDSLSDRLFCIAPLWPSDASADVALEQAGERIDEALRKLGEAVPSSAKLSDLPEMEPVHAMAGDDYAAMVARAKDYIVAGDIFQVVLSQRFSCPFPLPPLALYRALRRVNPSPFLYLLDLPGFAVVGSSPEILVRLRENEVTIRPIAGTRPRGATRIEDDANERSLLADPKERAEHLMLLDLGRNDVGRVAKRGSVTVTDSFTVERYSHVMHIVSNVTGQLDPERDALDALFAGFPAGTVSGAPKVRACEIIAELENDARGPYAGGVGYFAPDGSFDSCIVLRTAVVKDGTMHVQAGAGIVADSDPASEQRECEAKAGALFAAAREAARVASEPGFGQ